MAATFEGYAETSALLCELKKQGRECLYDLSSKDYKNNYKKQKLWADIAGVLAIDKYTCQARWRSIRTKYKLALSKDRGKSGSGFYEMKPMARLLLKEMDFFRKYIEDDGPTVSNYVGVGSSSSHQFQTLFNEMASDPDVSEEIVVSPEIDLEENIGILKTPKRKRSKVAEATKQFERSCKKLDEYIAALKIRAELDPYFFSLQTEIAKVPQNKRNALKLKILGLIYEAQELESEP